MVFPVANAAPEHKNRAMKKIADKDIIDFNLMIPPPRPKTNKSKKYFWT